MALRILAAAALALLVGCSDTDVPVVMPGAGGAGAGGTGAGGEGGAAECPPGTSTTADGCLNAGVPVDGCGVGFLHDGDGGCDPVLPAAPCAPGTMALPGDTRCGPVRECGTGVFGDIVTGANTQHVDAAYAGGDSTGAADKPWTTIQAAVDAADEGATVAVAAGTYTENVTIAGKAVHVWGRCPELVSMSGARVRLDDAEGTTVEGLGFHGMDASVTSLAVSGTASATLRALWFEGAAGQAITVADGAVSASINVERVLIEGMTTGTPMVVAGQEVILRDSVIRAVPTVAGEGIIVQPSSTDRRAHLDIGHSVLRGVSGHAVLLVSSDATVVDSVFGAAGVDPVRENRAFGLRPQPGSGEVSSLTLRTSVVETGHHQIVEAFNGDLIVDRTTLRNSKAPGIESSFDTSSAPEGYVPSLEVTASLFDAPTSGGIQLFGVDAVVTGTLIRDVAERDNGGNPGPVDSIGIALYGFGFDDTFMITTNGIEEAGSLTLRDSVIHNVVDQGVIVAGAPALIDHVRIADLVGKADGQNGSAVAALEISTFFQLDRVQPKVRVTHSALSNSANAAVANFSTVVEVADNDISCNTAHFNLWPSPFSSLEGDFDDLGGNRCSCDGEQVCKVSNTEITPPIPLP